MKVYLLSHQDYDGVEPISLHKNFDIAKAKAERLLAEYQAEVRAGGGRILKEYENPPWRKFDDTGWEYAAYQIDEMGIEE
jgi:hypothetical protein